MVNFEHNKVIFCVAILDDNFGLRTVLDAQALQRYHLFSWEQSTRYLNLDSKTVMTLLKTLKNSLHPIYSEKFLYRLESKSANMTEIKVV